ncbi:hypothetical protein KUCAC02_011734, partial [Chaenocephalus aceratus]
MSNGTNPNMVVRRLLREENARRVDCVSRKRTAHAPSSSHCTVPGDRSDNAEIEHLKTKADQRGAVKYSVSQKKSGRDYNLDDHMGEIEVSVCGKGAPEVQHYDLRSSLRSMRPQGLQRHLVVQSPNCSSLFPEEEFNRGLKYSFILVLTWADDSSFTSYFLPCL